MKLLKVVKIQAALALVLAACMLCAIASACAPPAAASYLNLNQNEIALYVGETFTLTAETDGSDVVWSSDAVHIATVEGGVVTAVAAGEATVKARVGNLRAYCDITVLGERPAPEPEPITEGNICELYGEYFKIGAAVQSAKLTAGSYGGLMSHFNSITPENNMKWKNVENSEGFYDFNRSADSADKLIAWAKQKGVGVRGHCLLWYKSLPAWLHDKFGGKAYSPTLRDEAYGYIDGHIRAMMEHFGDDVYVWDVVNEALFNAVEPGNLTVTSSKPYGNIWRTDDNMNATDSDWVDWFKVCGGYEYIARAFITADEVRKANGLGVELYYNDYALNNPYKRQACLNLIQMLRDHNAPIDGIGMQAHYKLSDYTADKTAWITEFENSVKAFIAAGVDVQITELDIRFDGALTAEIEREQAEMYAQIFAVCRKYAKTEEGEHGVTGVTLWGVYDGCNEAWGKNQYPLVFGTDKQPKEAYYRIINF